MDEVLNTLDFLDYIYGNFGFHFELELSTRPEDRLGSDDLWDQAEGALEAALNKFGKPWKLNAGDGAFYGPKIDIKVYDALNCVISNFLSASTCNIKALTQLQFKKEPPLSKRNKKRRKRKLKTILIVHLQLRKKVVSISKIIVSI